MDYQIPANLKALKGPKGDKGDPGRGLVYNGVLASTDDLPAIASEENEAYLIAGDLWAWDGIQWVNAGPVQGPIGPQGPRGLQGYPGTGGGTEAGNIDGGYPDSNYGGIETLDGGSA